MAKDTKKEPVQKISTIDARRIARLPKKEKK
jgi:hypothetical protein